MSLLSCIKNDITLEVYLSVDGYAFGELYLDDGETIKTDSAMVGFEFEGNTLESYFYWEWGEDYDLPESQTVTKVVFYGIHIEPALVLAANVEADFYFSEEQGSVTIVGFKPMIIGQGKMIELAWN